jgi:hypothetical protein
LEVAMLVEHAADAVRSIVSLGIATTQDRFNRGGMRA